MSKYLTDYFLLDKIMSRNLTEGGMMNLKQLRMSKNLTQIELAKKLKIQRTTVSMWETNKSYPNASMLKKLAQVLDCSVDELLKDTG